jgi:hypothetical protein
MVERFEQRVMGADTHVRKVHSAARLRSDLDRDFIEEQLRENGLAFSDQDSHGFCLAGAVPASIMSAPCESVVATLA